MLGDLHGLRIEAFVKFRNCGPMTMREISRVVRQAQQLPDDVADMAAPNSVAAHELEVPKWARHFHFRDLPIGPRLGHVLQALGLTRLGELHGRSVSEFLACKNCGVRTIAKMRELIARAAAREFDAESHDDAKAPAELLRLIEAELAVLDARDRELLLDRVGGRRRAPQTLEQIGRRQGVTRERVRQVQDEMLERLRKCRGPRIPQLLDIVEKRCVSAVCPLTPELLTSWVAAHPEGISLPAAAHVRLIGALREEIPCWPQGHGGVGVGKAKSRNFGRLLVTFAHEAAGRLPVAEAYARLRATRDFRQLEVPKFLARLRRERRFLVEFPELDRPLLCLRGMSASQFATHILAASAAPLTAEEIHAQSIARFGAAIVNWKPQNFGGVLTKNSGIYLVGSGLFGLPNHFHLPPGHWKRVRADAARLLAKLKRPVSCREVIEARLIPWLPRKTPPHELAAIVREDARFRSFGNLRFALAR